jgi:MFS family permease
MPASRTRLGTAFRALAHRNFQLFFGGQLISLIGTWMQNVAQSWLVYRLTGSSASSAFELGLVGFAGQIPMFFCAPFGGSFADSHDRRRTVVGTQTASMLLAFALAALTLTHVVKVWHVFVLAALLGVVNAYDIPARQAFIVEMVGKEDLMNAIALNSSMFNGARLVGPAVAGALVAFIGEGWCFLANAVSYLAVLAGLMLMTTVPRPYHGSKGRLAEMLEGFQFVATTPPIRALLLMVALVSFAGTPYSVLMPIFADDILHKGAAGLGVLMGASGVGAMLGALTLAARQEVKGLGTWVAVNAIGFGLSLIGFALSTNYWLSIAMLVPVGYCMMLQMACCNTLIQSMVPDHLRGRVMAVYTMMFMGTAPFGSLLAGSLGHIKGAPWTVAVGGVACIVGTIPYAIRLPHLRGPGRELIAAQQIAAGLQLPGDRLGTSTSEDVNEALGEVMDEAVHEHE